MPTWIQRCLRKLPEIGSHLLNAKASHFKSREQHKRKTELEPECKGRRISSDHLGVTDSPGIQGEGMDGNVQIALEFVAFPS